MLFISLFLPPPSAPGGGWRRVYARIAAMSSPPRSPRALPALRLRNQRTQALIRRDVTWQIIAPLALAVVAVLVVAVLLILPVGAPARSVGADVSLIFLIVPAAFFGLVLLALFSGLAYGVYWLLRELPFYAKPAQEWVALAAYRVNGGAAKVSSLAMSVRSSWAAARRAAADARSYLSFGRH
jgi:hypothetical protein